MNRATRIILIISVLITSLAFCLDYKYDTPQPSYTGANYLFEILVYGSLYVLLVFGVLYGMYSIAKRMLG